VRPPRGSAAPHSFGLGETELGINTLDADGVAFAAMQGLNAKLDAAIKERDATIANQARELAVQQAEIAALNRAVEVLMARTTPGARACGGGHCRRDTCHRLHRVDERCLRDRSRPLSTFVATPALPQPKTKTACIFAGR
jgi:hypothetical protein